MSLPSLAVFSRKDRARKTLGVLGSYVHPLPFTRPGTALPPITPSRLALLLRWPEAWLQPRCLQNLFAWPPLTLFFCASLTGYGERGAPPKIPGNTPCCLSVAPSHLPVAPVLILLHFSPAGGATLVFEVELLKIERRSEL